MSKNIKGTVAWASLLALCLPLTIPFAVGILAIVAGVILIILVGSATDIFRWVIGKVFKLEPNENHVGRRLGKIIDGVLKNGKFKFEASSESEGKSSQEEAEELAVEKAIASAKASKAAETKVADFQSVVDLQSQIIGMIESKLEPGEEKHIDRTRFIPDELNAIQHLNNQIILKCQKIVQDDIGDQVSMARETLHAAHLFDRVLGRIIKHKELDVKSSEFPIIELRERLKLSEGVYGDLSGMIKRDLEELEFNLSALIENSDNADQADHLRNLLNRTRWALKKDSYATDEDLFVNLSATDITAVMIERLHDEEFIERTVKALKSMDVINRMHEPKSFFDNSLPTPFIERIEELRSVKLSDPENVEIKNAKRLLDFKHLPTEIREIIEQL